MTLGPAGKATATFEFYQIRQSTQPIPSGSSTMTGSSSGNTLSLKHGRWIVAPRGYDLIDLDVTWTPWTPGPPARLTSITCTSSDVVLTR